MGNFPPGGAGFESDTRRTGTVTELPPAMGNVASHFALDVRNFGAVGDRVTDDAPAINAAIAAGATTGRPVWIPAAPANGTNRGYYLCNSSLKYYPGSVIIGDESQSTELRFLNNTPGIEAQSKTTFATFVRIKGLWLRGMADTSTQSTWTAGMWIGQSQYCKCEDVTVDRFVDGIVGDGTLSLGEWEWRDVTVFTSGYPNFTNRYPRYLAHLTSDGTFKPQAQKFDDLILYSNSTASTTNATSTGVSGQTIGPIAMSIGLWAESGIKVFAGATQLVSGTDYQVLANSSSGPVVPANSINAGGTRNSSPVSTVYVKLLGTQPNTTPIQIQYNDPYARKGLYVENSNAGEAQAFVSGCETAVQFSDTGVYYATYGADGAGNANNGLRFSTSYNAGTVSVVFVNPGPSNATTTAAAAGAPNYTVTVTLATDGSGNVTSTASQVIDAIRSDPTSYGLLDVRGTTFTTGAGPYPAALQGTRSDNSGIVAAFAAQQLTTAAARVAAPFNVDLTYAQICNRAVKFGSGSSGANCEIGTYSANVAQVLSLDAVTPSTQPQSLQSGGVTVPLPSGGDDGPMLQALFASPGELVFPYSSTPWLTSVQLTMQTSGKRVRGSGPKTSRIQATFTSETNAIISMNPQTGGASLDSMKLEGLGLIGNANTDNCVFIGDKCWFWEVNRCDLTGATGNNNGQGGNGIGFAGPGATSTGDTNTGQKYSGLVERCKITGNGTAVAARERSQWLTISRCSIFNNNNWGVDAWKDQTTAAGGKLFIENCDIESNGTGATPSIATHSYPSGNIRLLGCHVAVIRGCYMELASPWMGVNILVDQDSQNNIAQQVLIEGSYILGDSNIPYGIVLRGVRDVTIRNNWGGSYTTTDGFVVVDPNTGSVAGYKRYDNNTDGVSDTRTVVADVAYTQLDKDELIAYTSLTAARTVTLLTAVGRSGRSLTIKDEAGTAGVHAITVSGSIDGGASATINANYGVLRLRSNGTVWSVI